jgi:hypothetical protein
MRTQLLGLIDEWSIEYNERKAMLWTLGDKGDSMQYNLYATEALRLQQCIVDAQRMIIEQGE